MPPSPRKPAEPVLWIIAGPNGCGKSTLYGRTDIEGWGGSIWIINPDLLTQRLVEQEGLGQAAANLAAVQRVETWLLSSIEVHQTIGVETVLSSPKYRSLIAVARRRGFRIKLIYVLLSSVELQLERIARRVAEGGHDVPADKVAARRLRSFEQLAWFIPNVDECLIFDNSAGAPTLIAEKSGPALWKQDTFPEDLQRVLNHAGTTIWAPYEGQELS